MLHLLQNNLSWVNLSKFADLSVIVANYKVQTKPAI